MLAGKVNFESSKDNGFKIYLEFMPRKND